MVSYSLINKDMLFSHNNWLLMYVSPLQGDKALEVSCMEQYSQKRTYDLRI